FYLLSTDKPPPKPTDSQRVSTIQTLGGSNVISLIKSRDWAIDLYSDLVARYFNSDLLVRTWMLAGTNLPTYCAGTSCSSTYFCNRSPNLGNSVCSASCSTGDCKFAQSVMQVNNLSWAGGIDFARTRDHSKWAISADGKRPIVCIGDINTQKEQR